MSSAKLNNATMQVCPELARSELVEPAEVAIRELMTPLVPKRKRRGHTAEDRHPIARRLRQQYRSHRRNAEADRWSGGARYAG